MGDRPHGGLEPLGGGQLLGLWLLVAGHDGRHRTGPRLAAAETRDGANPKLRTLAQQMMTELQAQIEQLTALLAA